MIRGARGATRPKPSKRGFWAIRDVPTVAWLLLLLVSVLAQHNLPTARWVLIHLVLLGAVTHAILVWSQYFSLALLRTALTPNERRAQTWRLASVNLGAALVLFGVPWRLPLLTVVGALALMVGIVWHAASLVRRMRRSLPGRFGRTVGYYVASASLLLIGVAVGAWLAVAESSSNLVLAHAILNVLGWIGLTVAGTVVTLWPTILRTRADEHAGRAAARALPILAAAVLVAAAGAAFSLLPVLALGMLGYLAGLAVLAIPLLATAHRSAPKSFSALSVGMALAWWAAAVSAILVAVLTAWANDSGTREISRAVNLIVPYLVAGFALQILIGALSYLIPVVIGGGPAPVKIGTAAFELGGVLRVTLTNLALLMSALPVSTLARNSLSFLYVAAVAAFLPIMLRAAFAQIRAKKSQSPLPSPHERGRLNATVRTLAEQSSTRAGEAVAGLVTVALALVLASAITQLVA